MEPGGYNRKIDFERLGPTLVISASLILAVRTARKEGPRDQCANRDWEAEVDDALKLAKMVLSQALSRSESMFVHKTEAWYPAPDEDIPK